MTDKPKAFLICDSPWTRGDVSGRVVDEGGHELAVHTSSSLSWLRRDLLSYIDQEEFEVVDQLEASRAVAQERDLAELECKVAEPDVPPSFARLGPGGEVRERWLPLCADADCLHCKGEGVREGHRFGPMTVGPPVLCWCVRTNRGRS